MKKTRATVLTPAGTIRVLVVIVRYPETFGEDGRALWEGAQEQINTDHAAFATRRGYTAPVVVFQSTNVIVDPQQLDDPRSTALVRAAAGRKGIATANYEITMAIDLNPASLAGGASDLRQRSIYIGNFAGWKKPLGAGEWAAVARAAYHHEVAHQWGWDHDWAAGCRREKPDFEPFIAPPILFGWEDTDGDGVPEILSRSPYGKRR